MSPGPGSQRGSLPDKPESSGGVPFELNDLLGVAFSVVIGAATGSVKVRRVPRSPPTLAPSFTAEAGNRQTRT